PDVASANSRGVLVAVTGLFFLSGSAGLVYQVIWMRALGLFFGSDLYGVTIILSTFMGGLALGSLFGGRLAQRAARPLLWYAMAELSIGLFAIGFSSLIAGLDPVLRSFYPDAEGGSTFVYHSIRVVLSAGTLLIPTAMMGATLPLIMRHFVREDAALGRQAAYFYAINTLGALAGTLAAGFVLLPYLGMVGATWLTAAINVFIGVCCLPIGLRSNIPVPEPGAVASGNEQTNEEASQQTSGSTTLNADTRESRLANAALIAFGLSGFASFALEVVWTRVLLISVSATVYSFASMLACFLFGIFFGSSWISSFVDRHRDPIRLFGFLELGIGLCVGVLCLCMNIVPGLFAQLLGLASGLMPGDKGSALTLATLMTSFLFLVLPTTLLGATFSVALKTYTTNVAEIGSRTGNLYFANTFGAIIGSLSAGLIMIPTIGVKASLGVIALLFTTIGLGLLSARDGFSFQLLRTPSVAVTALGALLAVSISMALPYRVVLNFNQRAAEGAELLYHAEGIQNTIDVVRSGEDVTSLIIGGNVEADDGYTQLRHFILKGHLPLLMLDEPKSVLVVGLGMGITLSSTARHDELERIDVIELSPEILEAQSVLREINNDVTNHPNVNVRIDDGRSYVRMSQRKYDMITADPIHPKISRVGYLYTKEYYESIRALLNPGGVVCQWMPIYQMSPTRLRSAMKTFAEVFPNATFWYVKNHGLFIAKVDSPVMDYESIARRFAEPTTKEDLARIDINTPEDILSLLLMGPDDIQAYLNVESDIPINTDDYPYLEYFVPGDLFHRPVENVREIVEHLADPTDFLINQPPESVARVRALIEGRAERLVRELERPKK
ncbi:MAG: spermidine synthase, partial [Myxococcota bacterium]